MRLVVISLLVAGLVPLGCSKSKGVSGTEPSAPEPTAAEEEGPVIETEEVRYEGGGVTMQGYLAWDASMTGERPGVLVVHEWWGHNDYARKRARMLAELGYTAIAVDMYGDGKTAEHPSEAGEFTKEVMSDLPAARERFEAAVETLREHPTVRPDDVAAIGYCFGGGVVLHMARAGFDLDGVASFHGSLATETPAEPGDVEAEILVLHGGADELVPEEQVEAFRDEMERAGADYDVVVYDGAMHSFTNPDADARAEEFGLPLAYDAEADRKSWERLEAFLERVFEG
ncbi:MAG: dienelactone hydrolase family protein [Myxococcota bacterium]